jgi:predicted dehydrogenase
MPDGGRVNAAVIGCGRIGSEHAAAVRALGHGGGLSFCDPDLTAARRLAALSGGGAAYTDVDACLHQERPAVVHVCTPPATHATLATRALESGAAVLVEKPLALSAAEVAPIARALRDRPGALCIDHNFLFEPCMVTARRWTSAGRIGRLLAVEVFYGVETPGDGGPGAWASTLPGGRFTDLLPHAVYLARHFLGDVQRVAACDADGAAGRSELGVTLACAGGLAALRVSLAASPWELGVVLRGDGGTIRVDLARQRAVLAHAPRGRGRRATQVRVAVSTAAQTAAGTVGRVTGKLTGRLRGYPGLRALVAGFHRAVRDGLPPPVPFEDGLAVVCTLDAIHAALDGARTRA